MNPLEEFDQLFDSSPEEQITHDAQMLAFQFLSRIDEAMETQNVSKKTLAKQVGTSASFITQLFRGDRKPNWTMLAKMQSALNLEFKVKLSSEINALLDAEIIDYHRKLTRAKLSRKNYNNKELYNESILSASNTDDYALAG